jgi:predicted Holliday junction resolvase-like endonuclease
LNDKKRESERACNYYMEIIDILIIILLVIICVFANFELARDIDRMERREYAKFRSMFEDLQKILAKNEAGEKIKKNPLRIELTMNDIIKGGIRIW